MQVNQATEPAPERDRDPAGGLLVANRGEIAVRVLAAAADLGVRTVAVYAEDDADSAHVRRADVARPLAGTGPAAYLDAEALIKAALDGGCDQVHPGYGFLAENAAFAQSCESAGLTFVGPTPDQLSLLGDKARARRHAQALDIPVLAATPGPVSVEQARLFLTELGDGGAVMVKALAGGGGRGMRPVRDPGLLDDVFARCAAEAADAFGDGALYVERLLTGARHIEVQIIGDGTGAVTHLWERDCSVQRRRQKLVEMAPAVALPDRVRDGMLRAATAIGESVRYRGVGTVEFLLAGDEWVFLEFNPRLQVEHTVTEELTGVDLVEAQLRIAGGATLAALGMTEPPAPAGVAVQVRVNAETVSADGQVRPQAGPLERFAPPVGKGVRVDTHGYPGYRTGSRYDSLLAKVIVTGDDLATVLARARRALREFDVAGPGTNIGLLDAILRRPELRSGLLTTDFVDRRLADLVGHEPPPDPGTGEPGPLVITAPVDATVVAVESRPGDPVSTTSSLVVLEAMKMHHVVAAGRPGTVLEVRVAVGASIRAGDVVAVLAATGEDDRQEVVEEPDLDLVRPELAEVLDRHRGVRDEARPGAVAARRAVGRRTARENIGELCDPGTFVEYGALVVAAQRQRRSVAELVERTPADGLVAGIGLVGGRRCVVMSYDYTVLAGTQGVRNHRKTDRMLGLALRESLPVVVIAEGGGGRSGDTDHGAVAGLDEPAFALLARLSGVVPLVGIASGYCFAGHAAILGCCDVVIATEDSSIGMGGPAMIEAAGLGAVAPEDVGPPSVQAANGVIDVLVPDEPAAVAAARRYLALTGGGEPAAGCGDQRLLRHLVPGDRLRPYDVRAVVEALADTGTVMELRRSFGLGVVTALARIDGMAAGIMANNPAHLGGAIDADAADKAARFLQLCNAHGLPVLSLCDTPGFMVGPAAERTATVRHFSRMFIAASHLEVPVAFVVLRKAYGLGAMAMAGGGTRVPVCSMAWPTGEFGGMGLEGAVRLGHRAELEAIADPAARRRREEELVARLYEDGKALSVAAVFEVDDVIDPADTRYRVTAAWRSATRAADRRRRPLDAW
ncbi:carboxyl transferase domain-containing protein [Spongiactinospora sp. TRM90649]|uniref:carboxyl transferase domain-containing protein n=1 Tax=Spongiactinospora sp. TRM90649 TaxID=3031114 RepID=UPI0023F7432F|nr:carboxyl transferase domain-containing protein [Spongiactinospora sp. TRM90649]MDF5752159.1 carboxyl transferase domain-containing protein [Spongiactinospora sp. TRM90649]